MSTQGDGGGAVGSGGGGGLGGPGAGSGGSGAGVGSTASVSSRLPPKNVPGNRGDAGWKYGVPFNGDRKIVQCKFCEKVIKGGIYRFKHHLAGTQKDVEACKAVTEEVRKEMWDIVCSLQKNLIKKSNQYAGISIDEEEVTVKRTREEVVETEKSPAISFKRRGLANQVTINSMFKKDVREEACTKICRFIYNNAIPFNVVRSEEFNEMCEVIARHGKGFKPPSYHDVRVKYLKQEVETTKEALGQHRASWKKTGCTIMTDGWTDKRRRTILNFLVNSPRGTVFLKSIDASHISKTTDKIFRMIDEVVEEVGEENVVQVVTDNAANYKAAGEMLMQKRKRLYWTPCAAHCIDLMLEDFEKKIEIHKETIFQGKKITTYIYSRTALICLLHHFTNGGDLIRPATTRFATSYLTLGCLSENKGALIRMFTSKEWKSTPLARSKDGKVIENVVLDKEFWKNVVICLRGAYPLVRVLRLVDSDEKPAIGFIYEEMDRAKERIASAFNGVKKSYMPLWDIIDDRWDRQLHRPLHAAGYYLNPQLHYSPELKADFEVKRGPYECIERLVGDDEETSKIDSQLEDFKARVKYFGSKMATNGLKTKTPAQWWESYGDEYPELQKFAIRVLSLTCSSSGCERNWSAFEMMMSVKAISLISSWCKQIKRDALLNSAFIFMWQFFWRTTRSPPSCTETQAEVCLAVYEVLVSVLRNLASTYFPQSFYLTEENEQLFSETEGRPQLDHMCASFIQNINDLLGAGILARTRRAVLLDIKWLCLESLLSIPSYALKNGFHLEENHAFFSDGTLRCIFGDLVESLENAGESSFLPMLRSLRMLFELVAKVTPSAVVSCCNLIDAQMMWNLVHSSWILHVNCNKRRVASIAALLSSVLHPLLFNDERMHQTDDAPGPLKWFIENLLEEGTKSPRTIRLAALHLTGLWLLNPRIIKFYLKELKLLSLYGSVAFDEDFEAELADNNDARQEVSLLARSPDPELTEAFINTELYARVSVAVMFYKLADLASMVGHGDADCIAALESGRSFLLELLDSAVNDKDLAKELYKKYSSIHRRKIRVWQIICVLSPFVDQDIIGEVLNYLYISLNRNNLPGVRQYLETFAINIYLKFPSLVKEQLVPILRYYDMKQQALSSYVFIAANIILNSSKDVQSKHLDELFPPLVPLLTSHHHSLRGFTQLLVYQILHKLFPLLNYGSSEILPLEKRCFIDLKTYLARNSDCARLRASMEGYLDAYNPNSSVTPAGIFVNRVEEDDFECVPTSLMEQVLKFLNDTREDLRCSMAKDVVTIRNEALKFNGDKNCMENLSAGTEGTMLKDMSSDFQKKVTFTKHGKGDNEAGFLYGSDETYKKMAEIERDDLLLDQLLQSRRSSLDRQKASRQNFILVASLLDRIPNLAGLARTCEVFKASGLAIADTNIINDKQFQLISVTAEKWVPIIEVPVDSIKAYLQKKKREGFSILGLEQTANSVPLDQYTFPKKMVLVLGREKEGIPVDIIHILDACIEIPQLGVVRSLNVHVSGAIALWEYTRQQRTQ